MKARRKMRRARDRELARRVSSQLRCPVCNGQLERVENRINCLGCKRSIDASKMPWLLRAVP
jgi:uncharacterized protein with PIN domain